MVIFQFWYSLSSFLQTTPSSNIYSLLDRPYASPALDFNDSSFNNNSTVKPEILAAGPLDIFFTLKLLPYSYLLNSSISRVEFDLATENNNEWNHESSLSNIQKNNSFMDEPCQVSTPFHIRGPFYMWSEWSKCSEL